MAQLVCRLQQGLPAGEPLGDPALGRQLVPVVEGLQVRTRLEVWAKPAVACPMPACMLPLKALSACSRSRALPAAPCPTYPDATMAWLPGHTASSLCIVMALFVFT